jgi:acyl-CoA thioester hydrolase
MSDTNKRVPAPTEADFLFWTQENVRFADLDVLGHVNNNAYGVYFEQGRVEFYRHLGLRQDLTIFSVIVRLEIDFRAEVHYPATVRIGLKFSELGNSSFTMVCGMFVDGKCVATGRGVHVRIDKETRRPVALGLEERALMEEYL